ncbi:MAG: molybdenum cofactor biosynthesis protein MoaE [Methanomicrobiales archaeon]|nr:molybdenum cofactor biosynthesis protein MoaE [Methanomicrobiales archaeon]
MITITRDDVDIAAEIEAAKRDTTGAVVTFLGTVRDDGIEALEIEAYEDASLPEMQRIEQEAIVKFNLQSVNIIHRVGSLRIRDNILLIVVSGGHRQEAFAGCEYILERIKQSVPIWKKEVRKDGSIWVEEEHPQE